MKILEKIDLHYTEITNLFYDKPNKILYSSSYDNQLLKYNIFRGDKLDILDGKNNHLSLEGHEKWIWDIDEFIDNNKRRRLLTIDENGNVIDRLDNVGFKMRGNTSRQWPEYWFQQSNGDWTVKPRRFSFGIKFDEEEIKKQKKLYKFT